MLINCCFFNYLKLKGLTLFDIVREFARPETADFLQATSGYTEPGTILVILPGYSEMINSNHPETKERAQVLVLHSYLHLTRRLVRFQTHQRRINAASQNMFCTTLLQNQPRYCLVSSTLDIFTFSTRLHRPVVFCRLSSVDWCLSTERTVLLR